MVGLSDIPLVGIVVDRISHATCDAVFRGLRYLLCYDTFFIDDLNSQIEKIKIVDDIVTRKINAEKDDGKKIHDHVMEWHKNAENIQSRANELSKRKLLPDPVSRFRLGRKAASLKRYVVELTRSGEELLWNEISYVPDTKNVPLSFTTYEKFGSREKAYQKLWEALTKEDGHPIIGIYGMPGVGKTVMAEQAYKEARDQKIFDKITRFIVGTEKLSVINIQAQLAYFLNCHLDSDDMVGRASELKNSLMNGGKTLVIFDDVWDVIPMDNIGIPFGDDSSKCCKILLTSRIRQVCLDNQCKDPIQIKPLTEAEASKMFEETVGASKIESLGSPFFRERVSKACAAVPLVINAVGKEFKFLTDPDSWENALYRLKNNMIDELVPQVYASFQMSFHKLTDEENACILLCSMFPKNADIDIQMLFDLATGSQVLDSETNIDGLIEILKSSSLLIQGTDSYAVKMNDFIRDVARSIAARDPKYASIIFTSQLPDYVHNDSGRLLQLDLEVNDVHFPENMVCPHLHTLWLLCNNHTQKHLDGLLKAFPNLSFMFIKDMSLVEPIHPLDKLRVLILDCCKVGQTFLDSIPDNLETLMICDCNLPTPLYLPKLKNLKKLEISASRTK